MDSFQGGPNKSLLVSQCGWPLWLGVYWRFVLVIAVVDRLSLSLSGSSVSMKVSSTTSFFLPSRNVVQVRRHPIGVVHGCWFVSFLPFICPLRPHPRRRPSSALNDECRHPKVHPSIFKSRFSPDLGHKLSAFTHPPLSTSITLAGLLILLSAPSARIYPTFCGDAP